MRHEKFIGLVPSASHCDSLGEHLHYASPVLFFGGDSAPRMGRGTPVLVDEAGVGVQHLEGMKVVWGADAKRVCNEVAKGAVLTVFVSKKRPCKKIKDALKKLGDGMWKEITPPNKVSRLVSIEGQCCVQTLVNGKWKQNKASSPKETKEAEPTSGER